MDFIITAVLIGSVPGIISLLAYMIKMGGLVTKVDTLWNAEIPEKLGVIEVRLNTLWKTYVEDQIKVGFSEGLAGHSKVHITEKGVSVLPESFREDLRKFAHKNKFTCESTVEEIMPILVDDKIESIKEISHNNGVGVGLAAVIASLYVLDCVAEDEEVCL